MKDFIDSKDTDKKKGRKKADTPADATDAELLEENEDPELYYEGIISPEYRLKTVYVPYNAQGVSKANGYDEDSGESYTYTTVKMGHTIPGEVNHRMEEYRIRLDYRVVVPAFVAEALGNRADAQDYFP